MMVSGHFPAEPLIAIVDIRILTGIVVGHSCMTLRHPAIPSVDEFWSFEERLFMC
jgi:hypothetical protein